MESMRRQVEQLTLENERLQNELKKTLSKAGLASGTNWGNDEDGDGMERAAQLSTLTMDAQRPSSASSMIYRKSQEAALPSAQSAPLLQFTPGPVKLAPDKYSNDFDFSFKTQSQQPPNPPPLPVYNGEIIQAPFSATLLKQASFKDDLHGRDSNTEALHSSNSHLHRSLLGLKAEVEPALSAPAADGQSPALSLSAEMKPKAGRPPSASAATAVPAISVGIVKAAQVARPPSAGDRASDRSQNSERSIFSVSEANEGWVF
jgi:hypothetical protein